MFSRRRATPESALTTQVVPKVEKLWTDRLGVVSTRSLQVLIAIALATIVVFALVQLRIAVIPVLLAVIIAAAFSPLVTWMRRRGVPAMLASWIALIGSLLVLGGVITAIVFAVRSQWDSLWEQAQSGFDQLLEWLQTLPLPLDEFDFEGLQADVIDFVTSSQFGTGAVSSAVAVGEFVAGFLLFIVILFFFLKDGDAIWRFLMRPFDRHGRDRGERIGRTAVTTLGGYVRGTAIIAAVDAIAIGIALAIMQVPLALPLAVIVFVAAFVPIVGATVAGALAALVALVANGPVVALIVILVVIGVNQLEGNLLQPVVMAQSLKLHPLVILLALSAGTILGGIVGAVLSVPIAATAWAIVKVWDGRSRAVSETKPSG